MATYQALTQSDDDSRILWPENDNSASLSIENVNTLPELLKWRAEHMREATMFSYRPNLEADIITISYRQAYKTAAQLAQMMVKLYPKRQRGEERIAPPVVGILMEKSLELHIGLLATTLSGATWLPFDPDAPAARVSTCLKDSQACLLLCDVAHYGVGLIATNDSSNCQVATIEDLQYQARLNDGGLENLDLPQPHEAAYMIYTSGSTGTPKGIEISHSAALKFCLSERSILGTRTDDVVWQGFSPAFDMFIEEVWISIAGGAQIAIGSRSECLDIPGLGGTRGVWAQRGVTVLNTVPTLINIMTSLDQHCRLPPSIRLLNLGGEACPPALVKRLWHPGVRIINTYGPSEATVTSTYQELFPDMPVTIGKPLPNYHALILPITDDSEPEATSSYPDAQVATVATMPLVLSPGVEGELAIGGPCLGNGYVGKPELTAKKFIAHPILSEPGQRIYKTGDRVRLDDDMNLIFLGRIDTQVKHRGFRIELGEIESVISSHPDVQVAAVILSTATNRIEAYIVPSDSNDHDTRVKGIRDTLQQLPTYMHPEMFYFLSSQEMPRLPSGKINSKCLQDMSESFAAARYKPSEESTDTAVMPLESQTTIRRDESDLSIILRAMSEVFPQATNLNATSDFFQDLSGHSLAAATMVSKIRQESPNGSLLKNIGLFDVYTYRTAEQIIIGLYANNKTPENGEVTDDSEHDKLLPVKRPTALLDHLPVSPKKYFLCALAQVPALVVFFSIQAFSFFTPYLVFYYALRTNGVGAAIGLTYLAFVLLPIILVIIGIAGKWAAIGRAREGQYPLYGLYYYRWWLAERFVGLTVPGLSVLADTPALPVMMRLLGARVGTHCHIGATSVGAAFDLISIGDDIVIGKGNVLATSWIERGRLILAPVSIGSAAHIGSRSVIEGNASIEVGGELGSLSMLPIGAVVPSGQRWVGSPARFDSYQHDLGNMSATRPSEWRRNMLAAATTLTSIFIVPLMAFAPQIPTALLFEFVQISSIGGWAQVTLLAIPATLLYLTMVFAELLVLRWLVLGRVYECKFRLASFYFYRKWFVDRLMDVSLAVLHPVYATLYVVPFLRALGVKIGHKAEVSNAQNIMFELTEIGDECFVADKVLLGDIHPRCNMITWTKTTLEPRSFAGNASVIPQGTVLASNTLVGVLSIPPTVPMKEGESCFGSPAVMMPVRQQVAVKHPEHLLYKPQRSQIATRLSIEGLRIIIPRCLIIFTLGVSINIFELAYRTIGTGNAIAFVPIFYIFLAVPALSFTLLCKWILIGRYQCAEWPLWSIDVWKSEFVTSTYETLVTPTIADLLIGTPFLPWLLRLFGVKIGKRVTLLNHDITEYDMVTIGDEAVINRHAAPQTHLFEDRIMKIGQVKIGNSACIKSGTVCLPHSCVGNYAQLGCLSLVMKGETVPEGQAWEGAPICPS